MGFPPEENDGEDDRDDEKGQDMGGSTAVARAGGDGEDEENDGDCQLTDSRDTKLDILGPTSIGGGDEEERNSADEDSNNSDELEDPTPSGVLN